MSTVFDDFDEKDIARFKAVFGDNMEVTRSFPNSIIVSQKLDDGSENEFTLRKKDNGDIFFEIEDDPDCCWDDRGDRIYLVDNTWWSRVNDVEQLLQDYKDGVEIWYSEYV